MVKKNPKKKEVKNEKDEEEEVNMSNEGNCHLLQPDTQISIVS